MISLDDIRALEPSLAEASDAEVAKIRDLLYGLGQLATECYLQKKTGTDHLVAIPRDTLEPLIHPQHPDTDMKSS